MGMKVIQVVSSIAEESMGPSYTVPALCGSLTASGCDVSIMTLNPFPRRDYGFAVYGYPLHRFPHPALGRSPEMLEGMTAEAAHADILHSNSLWMFPNVYGWMATKRLKKRKTPGGKIPKLVVQPHGSVSEWALNHHWLRKCAFGRFFGLYAALEETDMWVATAESEADEIRAWGYRQPICILPNGIDLPAFPLEASADIRRTSRRLCFLSRIHPKKNVGMLIEVWARLEKEFPDWSLSIVGPDKNNAYADGMKALARVRGCRRLVFEGELNGEDKVRFMAGSDCLVLPTFSENFGMVVAESLACGTPVVCSHGAPWKGLETNKCGWWVETTPKAFEKAMRVVMSMSRQELKSLGANGREWMKRDYSWADIGTRMKMAYEWLLNPAGVARPEWVRT